MFNLTTLLSERRVAVISALQIRNRACRRAVLKAAQPLVGKGVSESQAANFLCSLSVVAETVMEY